MHQPSTLYPATEIMALGAQMGWSDDEIAHAVRMHTEEEGSRAVARRASGSECITRSPGGVSLHCPAFPAPCTYVRAVHCGFEIGCWSAEEWAAMPRRDADDGRGHRAGVERAAVSALARIPQAAGSGAYSPSERA